MREPYEALANAIVAQAARDYRSALKKLKRNPENLDALWRKGEVESFFRSAWYQELTNLDPELLIMRLKKEVNA